VVYVATVGLYIEVGSNVTADVMSSLRPPSHGLWTDLRNFCKSNYDLGNRAPCISSSVQILLWPADIGRVKLPLGATPGNPAPQLMVRREAETR
jgi:hypothetical protein